MDDDNQNKVDCHSEDYENSIFIQKLPHILEVAPAPGLANDSELREKETELPHKVALNLHSERGKQISLAWFASKADKWKDCSRIPIINIIYGLILLSFLMAITAFVLALHRCFPSCPDDWKYFSEKCYKYSSKKTAWKNARKFCQEEGANLVVINHKDEQDFLVYMMSTKEEHWIGFSDLDEEGTWKWVDGTPPSFQNWYTGKQNNYMNPKKNCAVLQKNLNFTWNDIFCGKNYKYICEKNVPLACVWQFLSISH